jgi:hypothetical protein
MPRRATAALSFAGLHPEDTMNHADLVIIESWHDVPMKGGCTACPDVLFDAGVLIGNKRQQEVMLTAMFTVHDQVHQPPGQRTDGLPNLPIRTSGKRSRRKPRK